MTNSPIRVALVEDDDVIRDSLVLLIKGATGLTCVAASPSAEDALTRLPATQPDVVLMDINLPRMSGIACVARLKAVCPAAQIVMLTMYEDDRAIFDSLAAGASGDLLKRTPHIQSLNAIEEVHAGGSPMTGTVARRIVQAVGQGRREGHSAGHGASAAPVKLNLSAREEEILGLLAQGYCYKEIAGWLGIALETVRTHLRRICAKLHVSTRTEAVVRFLGK